MIHCVLKHIPKLDESIKLTCYVTFIAAKIEVEFIKSCLQKVEFFKIFACGQPNFRIALKYIYPYKKVAKIALGVEKTESSINLLMFIKI